MHLHMIINTFIFNNDDMYSNVYIRIDILFCLHMSGHNLSYVLVIRRRVNFITPCTTILNKLRYLSSRDILRIPWF